MVPLALRRQCRGRHGAVPLPALLLDMRLVSASLAHAAFDPGSLVPLVGASGAISGVIAAYLLIWPRANIRVFYWLFIFIGTINVPAFVVLGLWIVEQLYALPAAMQAQGGIAIVGIWAVSPPGFPLTPFLKRRGVTLFQSPHSAAFARSRTRTIRRRRRRGSVFRRWRKARLSRRTGLLGK